MKTLIFAILVICAAIANLLKHKEANDERKRKGRIQR